MTTTTDLRSLTEAVGGDRIAVASLVPASMDAEDYQPKPQDVLAAEDAPAWWCASGSTTICGSIACWRRPASPSMRRGGPGYVDASFAIAVLELRGMSVGPGDGHAHGSGNPHYWLDPKNAEIITGTILEALARIDPANAAGYEANRLAFLARLRRQAGGMGGKAGAAQRHADCCLSQQLALFCPPVPPGFRRLHRDQTRHSPEPVASCRDDRDHARTCRPHRRA